MRPVSNYKWLTLLGIVATLVILLGLGRPQAARAFTSATCTMVPCPPNPYFFPGGDLSGFASSNAIPGPTTYGPSGIVFANGNIYVADAFDNNLYVFPASGGGPSAIQPINPDINNVSQCSHPIGLTLSRPTMTGGGLYVACGYFGPGGAIYEIKFDGTLVRPVITTGVTGLTDMATDTNGDLLVSSGTSFNAIYRVTTTTTPPPVATICASGPDIINPDGIVFDQQTSTIYVSNQSNTVAKISDIGSVCGPHSTLATFPPGTGPDGIAIGRVGTPCQDTIYVNANNGNLYPMTTSGVIGSPIAIGTERGDLVKVSPDGYLYATQSASVAKIGPPCFESPVVNEPVVTSKTADAPTSGAGATNGYTITITNPNGFAVTVNTIEDTLPAGFSSVSGSSSGVTTSDPGIVGQDLTWIGPFTLAANSSTSLHFNVTVSSTPGTYFNNATATATVDAVPTGDTAPVIVVAATNTPTNTPAVTNTPTNTATGTSTPATDTPTNTPTPASTPIPPIQFKTCDPLETATNIGPGPSCNLFICQVGPCDGPGEGDLQVYEYVSSVCTVDYNADSVTGCGDGIGAYEFQVEFDSFVIQSVNPIDVIFTAGGGTRDDGSPFPALGRSVPDCAMTILFESSVRFGCVTHGQADGPNGSFTLAKLDVIPAADDVKDMFPGNNNGIPTLIKDNQCELADTLGHPVKNSTNGAGLIPTCGDIFVTIRILEGDMNLDCVVNLADEAIIAQHYGAFFGSAFYNKWFDLEPSFHDLDVDIKDVQKVFGREGSTCQNPIPAQTPVPPPYNLNKEVEWVIDCDVSFGQEVNCKICISVDGAFVGCFPFGGTTN